MLWLWVLSTLTLSPLLMMVILPVSRVIILIFSYKIKTQADLQELLKKERKILGLSDKNIKALLVVPPKPYFEADVTRMADGFYVIRCIIGASRTAVAHELFHIHDGAVDGIQASTFDRINRIIDWIKYWYWYEPRAIFYEFRRLKTCNRTLKQAS